MKRLTVVAVGLVLAAGVFAVGLVLLGRAVGDHETLFQGRPVNAWAGDLSGSDPAASNRAAQVAVDLIIPHLTNVMFTDTNDSSFRMFAAEQLSQLPGMHVEYLVADGRRAAAITDLMSLGPVGRAGLPALFELLRTRDEALCEPAASAVVALRADPAVAIPLLMSCLIREDGNGRPEAVEALGEYGPAAKVALPQLEQLLSDRSSKSIMRAVPEALKRIDPETAAKHGIH